MLNVYQFKRNNINLAHKCEFKDGKLDYYSKQPETRLGNFQSVNLNESLEFINKKFDELRIKLIEDKILINTGSSNRDKIRINEKSISEIDLDKINNNKFDLIFSNLTINKFQNNNCEIKNIEFEKCIFSDEFYLEFNNLKKIDVFQFNDCKFIENVKIKFKDKITDKKPIYLSFISNEFNKDFKIIGQKITDINNEVYNTNLDLILKLDNKFKEVSIDNITLNRFEFQDCKILKILLNEVNSNNQNWVIKNINFEKSEFRDVTFPKKVKISKCFFKDLFYTNVIWFDNNKVSNLDKKETYIQLKLAAENNKNHSDILKFIGFENDSEFDLLTEKSFTILVIIIVIFTIPIFLSFSKIINYNKYLGLLIGILMLFVIVPHLFKDSKFYNYKKIKKEDNKKLKKMNDFYIEFQNGVILFFNKITNNHGQSWILPIGWIMFINLTFAIHTNCDVWNTFLKLFNAKSFIFSVENSFKICASNNLLVWDIIRRVLTITLIYQTVQAFRKYSRKL